VSASPKPVLVETEAQTNVPTFDDDRPRVEPGTYPAFVRASRIYRDAIMKRWVCLLSFDLLSASLIDVVAKRVPMFLNLGDGERPRVGRRSKYFAVWCTAAGRALQRYDRMSARVFLKRMCTVEIRDTAKSFRDGKRAPVPYSVVERILNWNTGSGDQVINQSTNQGRHGLGREESATYKEVLAKAKPLISAGEGLKGFGAGRRRESRTTPTQGADGASAPSVKGIIAPSLCNVKSDARPEEDGGGASFPFGWNGGAQV
jgi:hypothetical protein